MLEVLRLCRALGRPHVGDAALELSFVRRVETELGATLHDDVLAVLAARAPVLACATGLAADTLLDFAEDWGRAFPAGFVAVASLAEDPFAARDSRGEAGGAMQVLAVERAPNREAPARVMLAARGRVRARGEGDAAGREDTGGTTLAAFARGNLEAWFRHQDKWFEALAREKDLPVDDPTFRPAVVGALPAVAPRPERTVTHPKFGRGKVLESRVERGETKLVIAFEGAGQKVLLERFVKDA
jgi:hypothetical protein